MKIDIRSEECIFIELNGYIYYIVNWLKYTSVNTHDIPLSQFSKLTSYI